MEKPSFIGTSWEAQEILDYRGILKSLKKKKVKKSYVTTGVLLLGQQTAAFFVVHLPFKFTNTCQDLAQTAHRKPRLPYKTICCGKERVPILEAPWYFRI